ncbi:hypothetical protein E2562_016977 [Oryza meyeriana var. granulata]|uniref:Uncharacterized protein n=1 Tax=Oryza meyeriana var. granulata TaxID=110450 RepID=A0A6G1DXR4_9ORYZ|nr:hypothetical protein E2562_016977 [Oryza meyeriana var. granulata]
MLRNSTLYGLPADIMETDKTLDERRADLKAEAPPLTVEGYPVEGISIGGQETCVIFPTLSVAFDIGRCPQRAVSKEFLFISHAHLDHIGGLPMYVATRGLYRQRPPTIFIPACLREPVERLFELHRSMDQSELRHNLVPLEIGQEHELRRDLKVKAFKTYHAIPSKGYVIYTVKQKLKPEYLGLPGSEIKRLKLSGVEITNTLTVPEIAFTGDTMAGFILDPDNADVLKAKILVVAVFLLIVHMVNLFSIVMLLFRLGKNGWKLFLQACISVYYKQSFYQQKKQE